MSQNFADKILRDLEENENGFFQLEGKGGKAFLTVHKPGKQGKPVELTEVLLRIEIFGVERTDSKQIESLVKRADGIATVIGDWTMGEPEDGWMELSISLDQMTVTAVLHPPKNGGKALSAKEALDQIHKEGVVVGLVEEVWKLFPKWEFHSEYTVAKGIPPVPGTDAKIELLFDTSNKPHLHEDEHGRVDFKDLSIIQSVKVGELLARAIPSQSGKSGQNVFGGILPAPTGKEVEWKLGHNVRISPNQKEVYAEITGRPIFDRNGEIRVDEVIHLEAVDFSTGNIDFPGTIIVEEKILDGFELKTEGSIVVKKSIGKVFLKAKGDIILSAGFMGREEGHIESDSDIYARFVEMGNLHAKGSIIIQEASMHSHLVAGDSIKVLGGRGEIIGGSCVAGNTILCNKLGAVVETKTTAVVGTPPEILEELTKIQNEILEKKDILTKVSQSITKFQEESNKRILKKEEKETLSKLHEVETKYNSLLLNLEKQYSTTMSMYEPNPESFVSVEKEIHPGVEINLGKGKIYKVSLSPVPGKTIIQLGADGSINTRRNL